MKIDRAEVMWAAFRPDGEMMVWAGAMPTRAKMMHIAVKGGMGSREYDALGNDSSRWRHCYKRGFRIKRVRLVRVGEE